MQTRNPGEIFRQALTAMAERIDATREVTPAAYATVGQFIDDLASARSRR